MNNLALFIEPASEQLSIFSGFTLPRLGSFILAGMVKRRPGWTARVFIEGRRRFDLAAWITEHGKPDVVGISTITPTVKRGYALADQCRAAGIQVILGGPHVTFLAAEALEHSDLVVRSEGEKAMTTLLDLWDGGCRKLTETEMAAVPNLSWKDSAGAVRHNPVAPWVANLDELPFPDFADAGGTAECRFGGKKTVVVQTSRGCPFDCSFCSVTGMFGKKIRCRSVQSVLEELQRYNKRDHFVFFCDDNFTANKARARELTEAMIREQFKFQWSTQVRADLARDPDLVRLMKRAGCHTVFIGFESVNPASLSEMKKKQTVEEIEEAVRVIQEAGIHIHGMFVFGFEGDHWETVEETVKFAQRSKLTSVQLLVLTPLPGSELYQTLERENRITSRDWDLYDAHHVVFQPKGWTPFDLQRAQVYGHTTLYTIPQGIKKVVTGRLVAGTLSFYAWKINREWQKRNSEYMRNLATAQF